MARRLPRHADGQAGSSRVGERPKRSGQSIEQAFEPPRAGAEARLARIWCDELRIDRVGRHDDFHSLGGDSLSAVRLSEAIRAEFGVELPPGRVFRSPTIALLASRVRSQARCRHRATTSVVTLRAGQWTAVALSACPRWAANCSTGASSCSALHPGRPVYGFTLSAERRASDRSPRTGGRVRPGSHRVSAGGSLSPRRLFLQRRARVGDGAAAAHVWACGRRVGDDRLRPRRSRQLDVTHPHGGRLHRESSVLAAVRHPAGGLGLGGCARAAEAGDAGRPDCAHRPPEHREERRGAQSTRYSIRSNCRKGIDARPSSILTRSIAIGRSPTMGTFCCSGRAAGRCSTLWRRRWDGTTTPQTASIAVVVACNHDNILTSPHVSVIAAGLDKALGERDTLAGPGHSR